MQTSIRGLSPQADGFRRHSNTEASVVGSLTNLTQCIPRVSPMRTASGYQTPAVPYHTLICRSFSTPNTALVRKNAEYITNTEMQGLTPPLHPAKTQGALPHFFEKGFAGERGGSAATLPEGCFAIFRKLRNLAKDAHRGRYGTSCPAMPPLRLVGAMRAPTFPCIPCW